MSKPTVRTSAMVVVACLFILTCCRVVLAQNVQATLPGGKVRTYYIAALETDWNYVPSNIDLMTGKSFEGETKIWTEHGKARIGNVYRKAIYREYTDETFNRRRNEQRSGTTWESWDL